MTLKIHSTEAERLAEYRICQERGHVPGRMDNVIDDSSGMRVITQEIGHYCKMCGTFYWYETKRHESNKPEGAE